MSERRERERRVVQELAHEAHATVHLLLGLEAAITEPTVAAECAKHADRLSEALRRVLRLLGDG
jgi:hypothetical protein